MASALWFLRVRWYLLFASQLAAIGFGLCFSVFFGLLPASITGLDNPNFVLYCLGDLCGLGLAAWAFARFRRRTRAWEVTYELEVWARREAERRLHPVRAKCRRIAGRVFLWMPSALAAGVLFFLPVMSHLLHPSSHYLRHYKVPIPWNMLIFTSLFRPVFPNLVGAYMNRGWKGRFGIMTIGNDVQPLFSQLTFQSLDPKDGEFESYRRYMVPRWAKGTKEPGRQFHFGNIELTCREYRYSADITPWQIVACATPDTERERNLFVSFEGSAADVPAFYRIVEGIQPVE